MRTLTRDKKPVYICKKIPGSDPVQFESPISILLNTVATSSDADIATFGDQYKEYRRAIINADELNGFKEGDRAYIYNIPPALDPLCETADFEIHSILDSVSQVKIIFKRLQVIE